MTVLSVYKTSVTLLAGVIVLYPEFTENNALICILLVSEFYMYLDFFVLVDMLFY